MRRLRHPLTALALVVALTLPWMGLRLTGAVDALSTGAVIAASGVAVLGAAFVLTWAAETAEKDVPRAFALAVLAVIAVAPEYAVDALYTWEAGTDPGSAASRAAADLAVANMTGANRILIGLGWSGIALYAVYRATRTDDEAVLDREGFLADAVELDSRIAIEILFLGVATVYAFLIPLNGGIDAVDAAFLVGLYFAYIYVIFRGEAGEEVHLGVPGYFQGFSRPRRVGAILAMFAYSAAVILLAVKPFAKGLEALGPRLGVSSFFMISRTGRHPAAPGGTVPKYNYTGRFSVLCVVSSRMEVTDPGDIDSVAVEPDHCHRCGAELGVCEWEGREHPWCPDCELILSQCPIPGVHVVVHDDEEVLLLDEPIPQHEGLWSLPGGHAKYDEPPEEALLRELEEETGLRADPADLRFLTVVYAEFPDAGLYLLTYAVERSDVSGDLMPEAEGFEAAFRPLESVRASPDRIRDSDLERIEMAFEA